MCCDSAADMLPHGQTDRFKRRFFEYAKCLQDLAYLCYCCAPTSLNQPAVCLLGCRQVICSGLASPLPGDQAREECGSVSNECCCAVLCVDALQSQPRDSMPGCKLTCSLPSHTCQLHVAQRISAILLSQQDEVFKGGLFLQSLLLPD